MFVADFGTQNFNFKNNFDMKTETLTNHENDNDANRLLAPVYQSTYTTCKCDSFSFVNSKIIT